MSVFAATSSSCLHEDSLCLVFSLQEPDQPDFCVIDGEVHDVVLSHRDVDPDTCAFGPARLICIKCDQEVFSGAEAARHWVVKHSIRRGHWYYCQFPSFDPTDAVCNAVSTF